MATIVKSVSKEETWTWRDHDYVDGTAVRCVNHQFKSENRSFVSGTIEPNADHGWTTAASDYYYLITGGSGTVFVSEDDSFNCAQPTTIKAGDSFLIKAGTTYNYRAHTDGLTFALFMNNLWEE